MDSKKGEASSGNEASHDQWLTALVGFRLAAVAAMLAAWSYYFLGGRWPF